MGNRGTEIEVWIELKVWKLWLYSVRLTEEDIKTASKKVNFVQEVCLTFSGESELDFKQGP